MKRFFALLLVLITVCLAGCTDDTKRERKDRSKYETITKDEPNGEQVAAVIGSHNISPVELNYFYIDYINNYCNQYSYYLSYFLDTSVSIDQQMYNAEENMTWADFFLQKALDNARSSYALYDAAMAAGYTLSEEENAGMDATLQDLEAVATANGYRNCDKYLAAVYGKGAELDSYCGYYEVTVLAASYYNAYINDLRNSYTETDLRNFEKDAFYEYNSYSYISFYLNLNKYKQGGTAIEGGSVIYTDEEIEQAEADLKAAAESLAVPENNTAEALNAAIAEMEMAAAGETTPSGIYSTCTENDDVLYSKVNAAIQEWIRDESRREGDIVALPYETEDYEGNRALKGYYIVVFQSATDNTYALKNVRHILVSYEGGTTDAYGYTTYSDDEKYTAKTKAEEILRQWEAGDRTEASFAALATEKSTDPGSRESGGLYEDIYPSQMVATFEEWCFDEARKVGDVGIVQTDYGFHVMYFSGDSKTSYRDHMVSEDYLNKQIEVWETELNNSTTLTEKGTSGIQRDMVLNTIVADNGSDDNDTNKPPVIYIPSHNYFE